MRKIIVGRKTKSKKEGDSYDKSEGEPGVKYENNDGPLILSDTGSIPRLHIISRFIFPVAFLVFLAGYWVHYAT